MHLDLSFTNRVYEVTEDVMLDAVCWNSCDACPQEVFSIQTAIDQAADGSVIEIPGGDYFESLVLDKPITLTSQSDEEVRHFPPSGTGISIFGTGAAVTHLTIVGNELVGSGITVNPGASDILLERNSISQILLPGGGNASPLSYGILVWGNTDPINPPTGIDIADNHISNVLGSAISLGSNTANVSIEGNVFENIIPVLFQDNPLAIGVQAELCDGLLIQNNQYNDLLVGNSLVNCSSVR